MNIYQKLIQVRKSCEYLKKDNKGDQYAYVSSSQTLGTLRAKMDEMGLLLVPEVMAYEVRDHTTQKGAHRYFTILQMKYKWVNSENPEETVVCLWTGQGLDDAEKGVGKALTYAEKYFLLKFFNIATDKDDPDGFQEKHDDKKKITPVVAENAPTEPKYDPLAKSKRMIWARLGKITSDKAEWKTMAMEATGKESSNDWVTEDIDKMVKYLDIMEASKKASAKAKEGE